ncbi:hypothetical protein R6Q57_024947 [Mikania cordata]
MALRPGRRDGGAATWPGRHGMRASRPAAWLGQPAALWGRGLLLLAVAQAACCCGQLGTLMRPTCGIAMAH